MSTFIATVSLVILSKLVLAQHASNAVIYERPDQANFLKSSLILSEAQGSVFWPLYEQYERALSSVHANMGQTIVQLASSTDASVKDKMIEFLRSQRDEVSIKKELFERVHALTNGTVAFQVIQSEAIFNLIERSRVYERTELYAFAGQADAFRDESSRIDLIQQILAVPDGVLHAFRDLAEEYEFEYSRIVGHDMAFFELYIEDPADLTPGQSKKLGSNFLAMQENEAKLKERYFKKISTSLGDECAARFIMVEEYFSVMNKLRAWSEYLEYLEEAR